MIPGAFFCLSSSAFEGVNLSPLLTNAIHDFHHAQRISMRHTWSFDLTIHPSFRSLHHLVLITSDLPLIESDGIGELVLIVVNINLSGLLIFVTIM